jgi:hypothetical protein
VITHPAGMAYQVEARQRSLIAEAVQGRAVPTPTGNGGRSLLISALAALAALVAARGGAS